jgi:hypothetical protein
MRAFWINKLVMFMPASEMFGYRIIAAGVERMAAQNPSRTKVASTPSAELFDRFHGIAGTARIEPAALA